MEEPLEEKAISRRLGPRLGRSRRSRISRRSMTRRMPDPTQKPIDGDGDGLVFDDTLMERPALPNETQVGSRLESLAGRTGLSPNIVSSRRAPSRRTEAETQVVQAARAEIDLLKEPGREFSPDIRRMWIRDMDGLDTEIRNIYNVRAKLLRGERLGVVDKKILRDSELDLERMDLQLKKLQDADFEDAEQKARIVANLENFRGLVRTAKEARVEYDQKIEEEVKKLEPLDDLISDAENMREIIRLQRLVTGMRQEAVQMGWEHKARALERFTMQVDRVKNSMDEDADKGRIRTEFNDRIRNELGIDDRVYWRQQLSVAETRLGSAVEDIDRGQANYYELSRYDELISDAEEALSVVRADPDAEQETIKDVQASIDRLREAQLVASGDIRANIPGAEDIDEADLQRRVWALVDDAERRREARLDDYLRERYGEEEPWLDSLDDQDLERAIARIESGQDKEDRGQLRDWVDQVFKHDLIIGKDGQRFRTRSIDLYTNMDSSLSVNGRIDAFNEETGQWEEVGNFARTINPMAGTMGHDHLYIGEQAQIFTEFANREAKKAGFATIFNGHTFLYARTAGVQTVELDTAADGTYVWSRMGYRPPMWAEKEVHERLIQALRLQLKNFEEGKSSIIEDKDQAFLIMKAMDMMFEENLFGMDSPSLQEISLILDPAGLNEARREAVKDWFQKFSPLENGILYI